ncbi:Hypp1408 [Branchiostoma lanceolatum]|uniref:Hypp1408 protein n=1 Tax=Branchiostoma lanceolatum TaxID=7740 RepID=A0A8K0EIQ5_BRALA|nr:Hypp1408 [Branchiostoma lanceolatum]CAH1254771.1 Hypp1408 [Branchiostoma lanceolatum]CAH1254772.1 Hypp1408 [Branchiostoma lanceolatum]
MVDVKVKANAKELYEENQRLRQELQEVRSLYDQLVQEGGAEHWEERRVYMLKSHVIQLERQIVQLTGSVSSHKDAMVEADSALDAVVTALREWVACESPGPTVSIQRAQLTHLIHTVMGAKTRVKKQGKTGFTSETVGQSSLLKSAAVKGSGEGVSLLDICRGDIRHLNLKFVASLESQLSQLFKQLLRLQQCVEGIRSHQPVPLFYQTDSMLYDRLTALAGDLDKLLYQCCQDLMHLSLLVPSAPWSAVRRLPSMHVSVDDVMASLSSMPRSKQYEVKKTVESLMIAVGYSKHMTAMQIAALEEELTHFRQVQSLQIKYTTTLVQALTQAYNSFQQEVLQGISSPLQGILESYRELRDTASETALRDFLKTFKEHSDQLESIADSLREQNVEDNNTGSIALSGFQAQLVTALQQVQKDCAVQHSRTAADLASSLQQHRQQVSQATDFLKQARTNQEPPFTTKDGNASDGKDSEPIRTRMTKSSSESRLNVSRPTGRVNSRTTDTSTARQNSAQMRKSPKRTLTSSSSLDNVDQTATVTEKSRGKERLSPLKVTAKDVSRRAQSKGSLGKQNMS